MQQFKSERSSRRPSEGAIEARAQIIRLLVFLRRPWTLCRARHFTTAITAVAIALYWFLRLHYWHVVHEQPFSDTADYVNVANNILSSFTFYEGSFWKSFWAPGLPASIAAIFFAFGRGNQSAWQFSQTLFNFLAAFWMCSELAIATKKRILFPICLLIIALCKSSIFWSLKFATESLVESQGYLILALLLNLYRGPRLWKSLILGLAFAYAFLTKATIFASLPIVTFFLFLSGIGGVEGNWKLLFRLVKSRSRQALVLAAAFYLGVLMLWAPWMTRTYRLYHHILPFTTHQPISMLWEQWAYTIQLDGRPTTKSVPEFFQNGPKEFANDYELYQYASLFSRKWYLAQWRRFPSNILDRLVRVFTQDTDLTTVPRQRLFNGIIDIIMVDKSGLIFLIGAVTVVIGCLKMDPLQIGMVAVFLVPFLTIVSMSGLPRLFEPYIPIVTISAAIGCCKFSGAVGSDYGVEPRDIGSSESVFS